MNKISQRNEIEPK